MGEKCERCLYHHRGECKKGFNTYSYDCYFESRYLEDDEGNIIYSEEYDEDLKDEWRNKYN